MLDHEPAPEQADGAGLAPERPGFTPAKGRPTPKRSEAERRRREPYTAPGDRKAAATRSRDRDRGSRQQKMAAMRRGEEWALPAKDKGPVRALARDVVDARRGLSEYYLFAILIMFVLLLQTSTHGIMQFVILGVLLIVVAEGWWVGRRVTALARQRYPGESTRGIKMYAALRGTQIRRMRMPPPRVNRGDQV